MKTRFWIGFFIFSLLFVPAAAQNWVVLGDKTVDRRAENDTIKVKKKGTFRKIKLQVKGNGVRFFDLKVHFENGDVLDVALTAHINRGGQTRVIDLPGGKRDIKKVVFRYKTQGVRKRKATVVLLGRR